MSRQRRPVQAEKITTYEKLRFYAKAFGQGSYNCLIFIGAAGRMKSSIIEEEMKGKAHVISGHATPFEVFCQAQEHKDQLLVIDDADGLYVTSTGQRLLKNLTEARPVKKVYWTSDAPTSRGLDKTFETLSKVVIIDNAWNNTNEHIAALEDRSRLFHFDPSPREVHIEVERQGWFADDEIYEFIGENLMFIKDLSARLYVKALEARTAGEDWREFVLKRFMTGDDLVLFQLEYGPTRDLPAKDKADLFKERTGKSRATYFHRKRALLTRIASHRIGGKWSLEPNDDPDALPPDVTAEVAEPDAHQDGGEDQGEEQGGEENNETRLRIVT